MSKQYVIEKDKEYAATNNQSIIEAIDVLNEKSNAKINMWTCVQSLVDKTKAVALEKEVYKEFDIMYKIINDTQNALMCINKKLIGFYSSSFVQGQIAEQLFNHYDSFKVKFDYAQNVFTQDQKTVTYNSENQPIYNGLLTFATQETYELLVML